MAGSNELSPDSEATKWFRLALIGTFLYVSAAFAFVINAKVGHEAAKGEAQVQEHGQSD